MYRPIRLLYVCCLLLCGVYSLCAQPGLNISNTHSKFLLLTRSEAPVLLPASAARFTSSQDSLPQLRQLFKSSQYSRQNFATHHTELAFFCRLELKIEDATRMPVRFRLGSSQYVDYLEGKFEGWRYGY